MKLSTRSRYGVRLMTRLAMNRGGGAVLMKDISRLEGVSEKYLGQIIIPLRGAGLVSGRRGAGGGYTLTREPSEVTLRDIVEVLEGDLSLVPCTCDHGVCSRWGTCAATTVWQKLAGDMARTLGSYTLEDLVDETRRKASRRGACERAPAEARGMNADAQGRAMRLQTLKREQHATVLAHVYTLPEVQDAADFVGDSLGLSRKAAALDPSVRVVVFAGVHFMAETAAMLSPGRTVLLPDPTAGCPMADMVTDEDVRAMRREHPGAAVACYVNSTARVKAESDVCVTSSNAVRVIGRLSEREVIFVPDRSLGIWVQRQLSDKRLILWQGFCPAHHAMLRTQVEAARNAHPGALVLAHPENTEELLELADFIGSTEQIVRHARESAAAEFIIATENGILHRLRAQNPGKTFHPVSEDAVCPDMRKNTLAGMIACLEGGLNPVTVDPAVAPRALRAINRMLELS